MFKAMKMIIEGEKEEKEQGNWKNLFLIRLLFFPIFIKNYGVSLFEVSLKLFLLTSLPIDIFTGCLVIYIGKSTSNLNELFTD